MLGKNSTSIKDLPEDEGPRERVIKYGSSRMSDVHLFGILIGYLEIHAQKKFGGLEQGLTQ